MKKEFQAGTEAQQRTKADKSTSASVEANPMLAVRSFQRQSFPFGCGLYAVANALELNDFVTDDRLEISKKGVNNGQLSNYLQEDGNDLFIDVLYCDTFQSRIPNDWTDLVISGENEYMPLLIQCELNEKYHLISAKLFQDKSIEIADSLKNEVFKCSLSDINKMYEKVVGLYSFNHLETGEYVFF